MTTLILPDDRKHLPDQINSVTEQLSAEGLEPLEKRRLQQQLTLLVSLKARTAAQKFNPPTQDRVQIGTTAVVRCGRQNKHFPIAGIITFNQSRLPCNHPHALRLLGKQVGDVVEIDECSYTVISIELIACT